MFTKLKFKSHYEDPYGSVEIKTYDLLPVFFISAKGIINPHLVKKVLKEAEEFAKDHPKGWRYIVDTSKVRWGNPRNMLLMRKIKKLPNIKEYLVVAPSPIIRFGEGLTKKWLKVNQVFKNEDELMSYLRPELA